MSHIRGSSAPRPLPQGGGKRKRSRRKPTACPESTTTARRPARSVPRQHCKSLSRNPVLVWTAARRGTRRTRRSTAFPGYRTKNPQTRGGRNRERREAQNFTDLRQTAHPGWVESGNCRARQASAALPTRQAESIRDWMLRWRWEWDSTSTQECRTSKLQINCESTSSARRAPQTGQTAKVYLNNGQGWVHQSSSWVFPPALMSACNDTGVHVVDNWRGMDRIKCHAARGLHQHDVPGHRRTPSRYRRGRFARPRGEPGQHTVTINKRSCQEFV